jgi:cell division protein FtsW
MMPLRRTDYDLILFLGSIVGIIIVGFIFIYSASSVFALERMGSSHYFVKKHAYGCLLGLVGLVLCRFIPLNIIKERAPLFFFFSLLLTALTSLSALSVRIHGSARWLRLWGFSFQPSELLKASCILYLAYCLVKKRYRLHSFIHGYLPFLCILGAVALILLKQPDFGQVICICLMAFALFFITGLKTVHLLGTSVPLVGIFVGLIYAQPYRMRRIATFLNPWKDPQGAGFQIIQSLIAIGSGHFWGVGIAQSKQKFFYLPMQHTDFIFSIIAEETGFLGSSTLVTLYGIFLISGLRSASRLRDPFAALTVTGFVVLTSIQAVVNMAVATGLLPTKGIGLPFASYGNSALVTGLCMIGIVINCLQTEKYR